jgi:hypothetical protein
LKKDVGAELGAIRVVSAVSAKEKGLRIDWPIATLGDPLLYNLKVGGTLKTDVPSYYMHDSSQYPLDQLGACSLYQENR